MVAPLTWSMDGTSVSSGHCMAYPMSDNDSSSSHGEHDVTTNLFDHIHDETLHFDDANDYCPNVIDNFAHEICTVEHHSYDDHPAFHHRVGVHVVYHQSRLSSLYDFYSCKHGDRRGELVVP
mmetsp:Transcript_32025/g.38220  ORF Transcript_32025/g.38220 Transcript_32025/m.38220 type:complete len:122 (-) Transcript_32025:711-1076(-)